MKFSIFMIGFFSLLVLNPACSWLTNGFLVEQDMAAPANSLPFTVDTEVTLSGTVTGTIDDCAFDGICALVVDAAGETVNIIWAEGMLACAGQYAGDIAIGDTITAYGIARDANSLSICASPAYTISR